MCRAIPSPRGAEVEAVLRRHPCVWDVAAVEMADRSGDSTSQDSTSEDSASDYSASDYSASGSTSSGHTALAVVVQLAHPLPDAAGELAAYCRCFLPAAQVPAQWVFTDALPRAEGARPPLPLRRRPRIPAQAHRAPDLDH